MGIVLISVFLSTISNAVQGLVAFLMLCLAYYVQSVYKPFTIDKCNKLEELSILTGATTIYCGLLYLTGDIGEEVGILLFCFILLANAAFLFAWIAGMVESVAIKLIEKKPPLAKKLCSCFLKNSRFIRLATALDLHMRQFTTELGPDATTIRVATEMSDASKLAFENPVNSVFSDDKSELERNESLPNSPQESDSLTFRDKNMDEKMENPIKSVADSSLPSVNSYMDDFS